MRKAGIPYSASNPRRRSRRGANANAVEGWTCVVPTRVTARAENLATSCQRFPEDLVTGSHDFAIFDQFSSKSLLIENPVQTD